MVHSLPFPLYPSQDLILFHINEYQYYPPGAQVRILEIITFFFHSHPCKWAWSPFDCTIWTILEFIHVRKDMEFHEGKDLLEVSQILHHIEDHSFSSWGLRDIIFSVVKGANQEKRTWLDRKGN